MPAPAFLRPFSLHDESVRVLGKEDFENPFLNLTDMSDVYGSDVLDDLTKKGLVQADPKGQQFLNDFVDTKLAAGYSPLIPSSLQEKYKREADIDKYLKNMERLKKRGIV